MSKADDYAVTELCAISTINLSKYYYHQQEKPINFEECQMIAKLKVTAIETTNSYGKRRMIKVLRNHGHQLGIYKTASLMKKVNVVAINPKNKHYYPDSGEVHDKAPNVLKRQFNPGTTCNGTFLSMSENRTVESVTFYNSESAM